MKAINPCRLAVILSLATASIILSGCVGFQSQSDPVKKVLAPGTPTYSVEYRGEGQKPQRVVLPLTDTTYVDQALALSKLKDKHSDLSVAIIRTVPDTQRQFKMNVDYNGKQKRVSPECDYEVHPGDRIIVTDASVSMLDQMLGTLTGPVSNLPMLR